MTSGGSSGTIAPALLIAHRGASGTRPENTLAAFREAMRLGARSLECDVRLSRDGVPIILHDADLERTTDGRGPAREATLAEIRRLSAGYAMRFGDRHASERVPTLEEVLRLARGAARLLIELKWDFEDLERCGALVQSVVDLIVATGASRDTALLSLDPGLLAEAGRLAPNLSRGLIASPGERGDPVAVARSLGARLLVAPRAALGPALADAARAAGLLLATYTVDAPEELDPLLPLGLHAFATDHPERFVGHPAARFV